MLAKTRRLLIDLNRLITEENARYNRKVLSAVSTKNTLYPTELFHAWDAIQYQISEYCKNDQSCQRLIERFPIDTARLKSEFFQRFLPERLEIFRTRLGDRVQINQELIQTVKETAEGISLQFRW